MQTLLKDAVLITRMIILDILFHSHPFVNCSVSVFISSANAAPGAGEALPHYLKLVSHVGSYPYKSRMVFKDNCKLPNVFA
jgi:hypothetical protein